MLKKFLKTFFLWEIVIGLKTTFKKMCSRSFTILYPEEFTPKSPRFRGIHALMKYDDKTEKCISCKLCESICPARAINIETYEAEDGTRRSKIYEIDMFKCISCGMCEEACPVDAIVETNLDEFSIEKRGENIFTKKKLLAIGEKYKKQILTGLKEKEEGL